MRDEEGLTLLEVLVAVVILAVSFVVLIRSHIQSFRMIAESEILSRAAMVGENVCARMEAFGWSDISVQHGFDPGPPRLFYQTKVMVSPYPRIRKIVIRVSRAKGAPPLLEMTRWMTVK